MDNILYTDTTRKYFLLDYSPSHSELVIRGLKGYDDNIDLFFKAVKHIDLNPKLNGITISIVDRTKSGIPKDIGYSDNVFKIVDTDQNEYYIDAMLFAAFNNKLQLLQSSLGDFVWSDSNKEISSYKYVALPI